MDSKTIFIISIIVFVILIILYVKFYKTHKTIKCNSVLMISGAPKTGKTLLSVYFALQFYKKACRSWFIKYGIDKTLFRQTTQDFPLLYSNIPLANTPFGYVPLTKEHITRREKINEHSVVYIGEYSLTANSSLGMNHGVKNGVDYDLINEQLLLFNKLSGHQFGGHIIIDSQTISDVHFAVKRVLSNYLYIHHCYNIPFFKVMFVKELMYSDDNSTINTNEEDVENNLKWLLIPKKVFKNYDYRCYSKFTKDLKTKSNVIYSPKELKTTSLVSYSRFKTLNKEVFDNEEN